MNTILFFWWFPNAEHVREAANENLAVADRRRGVALLAQFVFRHAVERLAGPDDVDHAVVVDEVAEPLDQDRRGMVPAKPLLPVDLSAGRVATVGNAAGIDAQQVVARDDQRWNVRRPFGVSPGNMGLGHVA